MRPAIVLISTALAAASFAGCVSVPTPDVDPQSVAGGVLAFLEHDHDHLDPALHEAAHGLDLLAYSALDIGGDGRPRTFGELDVVGDLAVAAVLQPVGGFVTIDVSDPANPKPLGYYEAGSAYAADVKLAPDGKHAFLAVNGPYATNEAQEDPKLVPTIAQSSGIHVVSLADPAAPSFETFYPLQTGGVHMLDAHVVAGSLHVFSVTSSGIAAPMPVGNPGLTSGIEISVMDETPMGQHFLSHVAWYRPPEAENAPAGFIGPHDVTVVDDPELGPLMLGAYGRAGVTVASIEDPAAPQHLGTWAGHDGEYVHTVMQTFVDVRSDSEDADVGEAGVSRKRVIVAAPEAFNGETQNQVWILDAADPAAMTLLGTWRLPGGEYPFDSGYRFSTHNFNILDNRVYLAHFHAGVWVLDISTPERLVAPEVVAYHMPTTTDSVGQSLGIAAVPLVWDVLPAKGKVFALDIATGLHVLEPAFEVADALPYGDRGLSA